MSVHVESEPVYRRVAHRLRTRILAGELAPDSQLAPEPDLAREYGTSRPTLRRALAELEGQCLIARNKGRGTFVCYRGERLFRVGVLGMRFSDDPFFAQVFRGLMEAFENVRREFVFLNAPGEMLTGNCDGVIAVAPDASVRNVLEEPRFAAIPMVLIDVPSEGAGRHCCTADAERHPLYHAVAFLHDLGHRRIGYVSCVNRENANLTARNQSFREAAHAFALEDADELVYAPENARNFNTVGRDGVDYLLAKPEPPTALVLPGREISVGVWQRLMERNVRIPEMLSVVGFDMPNWANPKLSTLLQPHTDVARGAGEMLIAQMGRGPEQRSPQHRTFPLLFENRGSTAAPCKVHSNKGR